jgi:phosphatidylserine/phosphatidylglycerophosphate/cardiolipin synthase-like enzyme
MNIHYLENEDIYTSVITEGILRAEESVWIGTANVKDLRVGSGKRYVSILKSFKDLCKKGVEIRILHSGIPSEPFLEDFRKFDMKSEERFTMRRCLRVHFKCVILDGKELFIGSPNLTGAGIGAKGRNRRNFEIGLMIDDEGTLRKVSSLFMRIWKGKECPDCGRKKYCYVPLEEPG